MDPDSAVRAACVSPFSSFASYVPSATGHRPPPSPRPPSTPLEESLSREMEASAQSTASLCLSAAIDSSPSLEPAQIAQLLPKWMKLLQSDGFKAKPALLSLVRSGVRVCEMGNGNLLRDLVAILVEFLKRDDWAVRKAAAEALTELAVRERGSLLELKASCLKTFESRRFDKVKATREAMDKMVEVWKEIPDVLEDGSPPPLSQASTKENARDGSYPLRSRVSSVADSNTPQSRRKNMQLSRSSPSDSEMKTTARNRAPLEDNGKMSSPLICRKLDYKKPSDWIIDNSGPCSSSMTSNFEESRSSDRILRRGKEERTTRSSKLNAAKTTAAINVAADQSRHHHRECEDLAAICKQLAQIENQQSSLMDLLQKFIGTSQEGMPSMETRVNCIETALADMSYELALSTARMARSDPPLNSCCLLPGSDFLSFKFWKRSAGEPQRFSFPVTSTACTFKLENMRSHRHGGDGFIVNPPAEIQAGLRGSSRVSSTRVPNSVHSAA